MGEEEFKVTPSLIDAAILSTGPNDPPSACVKCELNWVEIQYRSSIPENMPQHMEAAGLKAKDIKPREVGMSFAITDVDRARFRKTSVIPETGAVRVYVPTEEEEVLFAFESERPDETLPVPKGEVPGEEEEGWIEGVLRGVVSGSIRGINEFLSATYALDAWFQDNVAGMGALQVYDEKGFNPRILNAKEYKEARERGMQSVQVPNIDRPTSNAGALTEGVSQFLVGFIPALRAVRITTAATAAGKTAQFAVAGAIADATVFDPNEKRLSNLIQQFPELQTPVTAYLASAPGDTQAEGRLKNALEGLLFGATLDGFIRALRVMKYGITRMVAKMRVNHRYVFHSEALEAVVEVLLKAARRVEPVVTGLLQEIAQRTKGTLEGLEFRIKGEASLARKITGDASESGEVYSKAAAKIKDVLRYTIAYSDEAYTQGVKEALETLAKKGYGKVRLKNNWNTKGSYQGINAAFKTPRGYEFELQFHTKASLDAKESTHKLYEEARILPKGIRMENS